MDLATLPAFAFELLSEYVLASDLKRVQIALGSRNGPKVLQSPSRLEFDLECLDPFPFWAFNSPQLRTLHVAAINAGFYSPLSLNGRFILPPTPLQSLTKLVVEFEGAASALFGIEKSTFLCDVFPALIHLKVTSKTGSDRWCDNLPTNLKTLSLRLNEGHVSPNQLAKLPRGLETLKLNFSLNKGEDAQAAKSLPPNLKALSLRVIYESSMIAELPATLTLLDTVIAVRGYDSRHKVRASWLPPALQTLRLHGASCELIFDKQLPPSLKVLEASTLDFFDAQGKPLQQTITREEFLALAGPLSSLTGALPHSPEPLMHMFYDHPHTITWTNGDALPAKLHDLKSFASGRSNNIPLDLIPATLNFLRMETVPDDHWGRIKRFRSLEWLTLYNATQWAPATVWEAIAPSVTSAVLSAGIFNDVAHLKHFSSLTKLVLQRVSAERLIYAHLPPTLRTLEVRLVLGSEPVFPDAEWYKPLEALKHLKSYSLSFHDSWPRNCNEAIAHLPKSLESFSLNGNYPYQKKQEMQQAVAGRPLQVLHFGLLPPRLLSLSLYSNAEDCEIDWNGMPEKLTYLSLYGLTQPFDATGLKARFPLCLRSLTISEAKGLEYPVDEAGTTEINKLKETEKNA